MAEPEEKIPIEPFELVVPEEKKKITQMEIESDESEIIE